MGKVRQLIPDSPGCIVSNRIAVEGLPVRFMYRDKPCNSYDTGWCFLSGHESDAYMNDARNHTIFALNTIANYDPGLIPFLGAEIGCVFERDDSGEFVQVFDYPIPDDEEEESDD
nr:DUF2185 domain-containing protein [Acetobacter sp. AN02]